MKTTPSEAERLASQHHHELRNLTALTGTIVGAAIGTVGGVPGMGLGALVFGAGALVSGVVLERENRRAASHDRELDDDIGVTTAEIGAAEAASSALGRRRADDEDAERARDRELLALDAELGETAKGADATIEPLCPDCAEVRRASANHVLFCAHHSVRHPHGHLHYEYPPRFAVGSMWIRPESW